ncbi:MAG: IgGFc-binding protein [Tannerellaceae bacterium]|jgi:hypothetical protein|nr:IgGFc-binding protein [Tannerellaceae bacterium]
MMKIKFLLGCFFVFCSLSPGLWAQDTEFWFAAPDITEDIANSRLDIPTFLAISNSNYQSASVTITLYNGGSSETIGPVTIAGGGLYKYDFNTAALIGKIENPRSSAGTVTTYGIHIVSSIPVTAYYMVNHTESRDIWTLKGHQALGTTFYVTMQSDNAAAQSSSWPNGRDQVDIVATENGTVVEVTPKTLIKNGNGTSPANTLISRTLNKGQTLKIMENSYNITPLTGSLITSTKPIAVTVTEDLVQGDTSGDQIVPISSLGKRYIVPRGYKAYSALQRERIYFVSAYPNTTIKVWDSTSSTPSVNQTLTSAGEALRYNFPYSGSAYTTDAIYVESTQPIYVYHRSGYGEEGAALIPSLYAIGQTQLSFFQVGSGNPAPPPVQEGFLVFRTGAHTGFTIQYGTGTAAALSLTPINVPNMSDWKVARFSLAAPPTANGGQVVKIENPLSPFSFGYITGNQNNNDSYGYFSAFGDFEFPGGGTTYMCGDNVTLTGGYAMNYKWTLPDGSVQEGEDLSSISATQTGTYTLEMNQDPNTVTATTNVVKVNAGTIEQGNQKIFEGETPLPLSVTGATLVPNTEYQWQSSLDGSTWNNISGATYATYAPGPLTTTTFYRRGMSSEFCALAYTYSVMVTVKARVLPVNPHLMGRFRN